MSGELLVLFAEQPRPPLVLLPSARVGSTLTVLRGHICDRQTVKTWCRERRVSAASRGIAPGRIPDPLSVYMRASSRGDSAPLASRVFCELVASVAPLAEGPVVQCGLWESLRVFLRHSGEVPKGYLKAASAVFLEATACELDAAQADKAHDLAWSKLRSLTRMGGAKWKGARALPGRTGEDCCCHHCPRGLWCCS